MVAPNYLLSARSIAATSTNKLVELSFHAQNEPLLFRGASLGGVDFPQYATGLSKEPLDLETFAIHEPQKHPGLVQMFKAVDNLQAGSVLLRATPTTGEDSLFNNVVIRQFLKTAFSLTGALLTNPHGAVPSVDDFKQMAIVAFNWSMGMLHGQHAASLKDHDLGLDRDWPALLKDDIRWCLAYPKHMRDNLVQAMPQTKPLLDAFEVHCSLLPMQDAVRMVWSLPLALDAPFLVQEEMPLPDLAP